ncbi:hypothetical protein L208DRAFT_1375271 [Tricholoma matsutake]|nr:hypothetical protein L208DRAFT_1375271 [Tricholoma matsutake 945]
MAVDQGMDVPTLQPCACLGDGFCIVNIETSIVHFLGGRHCPTTGLQHSFQHVANNYFVQTLIIIFFTKSKCQLQPFAPCHFELEEASFAYESDNELDFEDPLAMDDPDSDARAEGGVSMPTPPNWEGLSNKERKRRAKKQCQRANDLVNLHIKAVTAKRCAQSVPLKTNLNPGTLPIASSGWIGSWPAKVKEQYCLEELLGPKFGMKLVDWDRWYAFFHGKTCCMAEKEHTPRLLVDWEDHVISALAGYPQERWDEVARGAVGDIRAAQEECTFTDKQNDHW